MSRIGKQPLTIPENVTVTQEKQTITVKGPNGELSLKIKPVIEIKFEENQILVSPKNNLKTTRALHGTTRNLLKNLIIGVTEGFKKELKLVGVGYRVRQEGKNLDLSLGYSHPVKVDAVDGIELKVEGQDKIIVQGSSKYQVGQVAANIRALRPPEPYKGKGIKYADEHITKKAGKAGKAETS